MTPTPTPNPAVERNNNEEMTPENDTMRIWCDGCYDMVHFGHANNLRQAKLLSPKVELYVGVHSDDEVAKHKGCPPVFNEQERYTMIRAIKWVDRVIEAAPYVTTIDTLDKHHCQFCAHGNDITTTADGSDTYQAVKDAKRYKEVERTHGVSTTDLVGRILARGIIKSSLNNGDDTNGKKSSPYSGKCQFLPTTRKLQLFSDSKEPAPGDKIVYVDGTFDIFHPGHVAFLQKAKEQHGNYLIVGLHSDATVAGVKGLAPIMNLHERVLSILACRYVDEVIIGAPYTISEELLNHFNVKVVLHGKSEVINDPFTETDPYSVPKARGVFTQIDSGSSLTTDEIVRRVTSNRDEYEARNAKKEAKELQLIEAMASEQ